MTVKFSWVENLVYECKLGGTVEDSSSCTIFTGSYAPCLCILTKEFFVQSIDNRYNRRYHINKMNGINRSQKKEMRFYKWQ